MTHDLERFGFGMVNVTIRVHRHYALDKKFDRGLDLPEYTEGWNLWSLAGLSKSDSVSRADRDEVGDNQCGEFVEI